MTDECLIKRNGPPASTHRDVAAPRPPVTIRGTSIDVSDVRKWAVLTTAVMLAAGCSSSTPTQAPQPSAPPRPRYGPLMVEIGRRFEVMGRAARAHRSRGDGRRREALIARAPFPRCHDENSTCHFAPK
jgi:hypothetical protein